MNKTKLFAVAAAAIAMVSCAETPKDEMTVFIDDLMSRMTIEEKLGQMSLAPVPGSVTGVLQAQDNVMEGIREGKFGAILNGYGYEAVREYQRVAVEESRLGIPLIVGYDVIHGHKTVFPIPLALASSWDTLAIKEAARISAKEATADGINWAYSPMVDIARDPRWGRVAEGAGEDPYLGSLIATAMVHGLQGDPGHEYEDSTTLMACLKHFALYGASAAGRDYREVDMSKNLMYNDYLPPYKAAIKAGVGSVMTSFNDINGTPATANKWLLTDLLRDEWGFDGFVVTDYTAISEMINHGLGNLETVSKLALKAGVDMDMVSPGFYTTLGEKQEEMIDQACRRVLEAKYKLGLFKNPYRYCVEGRNAAEVYCQEHKDAARRIAAESMVLLKNSEFKGEKVLPLKKKGTIAVIGPLSDAGDQMMGTWAGAAFPSYPSVLEGITEVANDRAEVLYAQGSWVYGEDKHAEYYTHIADGTCLERDGRTDEELLKEALSTAAKADVIVAVLGETAKMSGEASSRSDISIPAVQKDLLKALVKTGKPVVLCIFAGRPLTLEWEDANVPAILNTWFSGSEGGYAIADVLFGDANPSAKITMTFPRNVGQIPIFYNMKNSGRPIAEDGQFHKYQSNYLDVPNSPLYPFGYGLSYSEFEYSDVELSDSVMSRSADACVIAKLTVTNTSSIDGDEIVQLYTRDLAASITRPVKELKGFRRVHIPAGESVTVEFEIKPQMLGFYKTEGEDAPTYVVESGDFTIMTGPNSRDVSSATLTLE